MSGWSTARVLLTALQDLCLARIWGPTEYGTFVLIVNFADLVVIALDPRSQDPTVKYCSEFDAKGQPSQALAAAAVGYIKNFVTAVLLVAATVMVADWGARRIVHRPDAGNLILLYAASYIPFSVRNAAVGVLTSIGKFSTVSIAGISTFLFQFLLILSLAYLGYGIAGGIVGLFVSQIVGGISIGLLGIFWARRIWGAWIWQASLASLKGRGKEILLFYLYNDLTIVATLVFRFVDILVLGYVSGPTAAGYYRVARGVIAAIDAINPALQSVLFPRFSRLWSTEQIDPLRRLIHALMRRVGPLWGIFWGGAAYFASPLLIRLLVGPQYEASIVPSRILSAALAFGAGSFWLRPFLLATGYVGFWTGLAAALTLFSIVACYGGALLAQQVGVAWARVGGEALRAIIGSLKAVNIVEHHPPSPQKASAEVILNKGDGDEPRV